ncbi:hypothetical protein S40288_10395 [Stachybotrys chartarum IBT 40288]|nr:hypothetical protein S40288_10395 [Stachybotrys chartarum IBT 40288]
MGSKSWQKPLQTLAIEGFKVLGSYIGPLEGRRAFLTRKLKALEEALEALLGLPKQHALLLLRGSTQLLLRHLLWQLEPEGLADLWARADALIQETIAALASRTRSPEALGDLQRDLIALLVRAGGLGIPSHEELAPDLYRAAQQASEPLLNTLRS